MTGRARRIVRNATFNIGTEALSSVAFFLVSIIVARGLGPTETGVFSLVSYAMVAVTTLAATGVGMATSKFVAQFEGPESRDKVVGVIRVSVGTGALAVTSIAILMAASGGLLADAFNEPDASTLFPVAALVTIPMALTRIAGGALAGLQRQDLLLPMATTQGVVMLGGTGLAVGLGGGVLGVLLAYLAAGLCAVTFGVLALRRALGPRKPVRLPRELRRRIVSYSASVSGLASLDLIVWHRSEVVMLGVFEPAKVVAYYALAFALAEAAQQLLPNAFSQALFPNLSRAIETGDREFFERGYAMSVRLLTAVTLPIAVVGALLSGAVVDLLYGSEFAPVAPAFAALLFSAGLGRIGYAMSTSMFAADRERLLLYTMVVWAVLNLALGIVLIKAIGLTGAVVANVTVQTLAMIVQPWLVKRSLGMGLPWAGLARVVLASVPLAVAVGAVALLVPWTLPKLVLGGLVAVPAYVLGLRATNALEQPEIDMLRTVRDRVLPAAS